MLTLVGIVIVVIGFVLRINPLLVVTIAGLATGIAGGLSPLAVVAAFGKAFITSRYVAIVWLVLPVIGLLEHAGLKERARAVVAGLRAATTSRVLLVYFTIRQITAALGLTSLGGHAQMVRPLIAPQLAIWAIPTAICAFVIHCTRLLLLDRSLRAELSRKTDAA